MITKGSLLNGAFVYLRISGLTSSPTGDELAVGLQILDDKCAELSTRYSIGYNQPRVYGESQTSDDSGLTPELAAPIKKIIALELAPVYKPDANLGGLQLLASDGMKAIQQIAVDVPKTQYPETLPTGSGNTWRWSETRFFGPPSPEDSISVIKGESEPLIIDWSSYLQGAAITAVNYHADGQITISDESNTETETSCLVGFTQSGVYKVCVTISSNKGENKEIITYAVRDC